MTLQDLRNLFADGTEFELYVYGVGRLKMTNLLWGNAALARIQPTYMEAKNNRVVIHIDMPESVFKAWKEYSDSWEGR